MPDIRPLHIDDKTRKAMADIGMTDEDLDPIGLSEMVPCEVCGSIEPHPPHVVDVRYPGGELALKDIEGGVPDKSVLHYQLGSIGDALAAGQTFWAYSAEVPQPGEGWEMTEPVKAMYDQLTAKPVEAKPRLDDQEASFIADLEIMVDAMRKRFEHLVSMREQLDEREKRLERTKATQEQDWQKLSQAKDRLSQAKDRLNDREVGLVLEQKAFDERRDRFGWIPPITTAEFFQVLDQIRKGQDHAAGPE